MDQTKQEFTFNLWSIIDKLDHQILLIRQRELMQYDIAVQQLSILRSIKALGSEATLSKIARNIDREIGIVSRQTVVMEKDGLIKRIKDKPKSRRLRIELTDKGLDLIKIRRGSKTIDSIFSVVDEKELQQIYLILNRMSTKANKILKTK